MTRKKVKSGVISVAWEQGENYTSINIVNDEKVSDKVKVQVVNALLMSLEIPVEISSHNLDFWKNQRKKLF